MPRGRRDPLPGRNTYKTAEDLVTGLHRDWAPAIVYSHSCCGFAVRAESAVESYSFHAVVEETIVCLRRVEFRQAVDIR